MIYLKKNQGTLNYQAVLWRFVYAFITILIFLIGIYAWRWVQKPTSFPIRHINIQGQLTHESPRLIEKIMRTQLSGGFFSLNVSAVKQAILAFPWVATVSFRRVWPQTLNVQITEQQAIARFGKTGVLNADGIVFHPAMGTLPKNLPDLEGPADQSKVLFNFYQAMNPLAQLLGLSVIVLRVNDEHSWRLWLSNHIQVTLGRQEPLPRFKRFIALYPKMTALSKKTIVSVDLRYPNGIAVKYSA